MAKRVSTERCVAASATGWVASAWTASGAATRAARASMRKTVFMIPSGNDGRNLRQILWSRCDASHSKGVSCFTPSLLVHDDLGRDLAGACLLQMEADAFVVVVLLVERLEQR